MVQPSGSDISASKSAAPGGFADAAARRRADRLVEGRLGFERPRSSCLFAWSTSQYCFSFFIETVPAGCPVWGIVTEISEIGA